MKMILVGCLAVLSVVGFGCAAGVDSQESSPSSDSTEVQTPAAPEQPESRFSCVPPYANCAIYCSCDYQDCIREGNPQSYCADQQGYCMATCPR